MFLVKSSSLQTKSLPLVLEDSGSDLSRSEASIQNDAHGELGVTCNAEDKKEKREAKRINKDGSR